MRPDSLFRFESAVRLPAILFGALAVTLMLVPGLIYWLFGMDGGTAANIMSRRAACLFVGLGLICWMAATWSQMDRVISAGVAASMGALAVLGLVEYLRGAVGAGIWLAIVVELMLVALFVPHISR